MEFSKRIYGIRWGKMVNNKLEILYEQNNLFNLDQLKEMVKRNMDILNYFVCKEQRNFVNGYTFSRYTWLECEKDFIYTIFLEPETVLNGLSIN